MPIYLRNFYLKQLEEIKKLEVEAMTPKQASKPKKR
jgi:hypothetical protein